MQGSTTHKTQPETSHTGGILPNHAHQWRLCKHELAARIPAPFFERFIRPIESDGADSGDGQLRLFVPTDKLRRHIESRYIDLIQETLGTLRFRGQVSFVTGQSPAGRARSTGLLRTGAEAPAAGPAAAGRGAVPAGRNGSKEEATAGTRTTTAHNARHPRDLSWKESAQFHPNATNAEAVSRVLAGEHTEAVMLITGPAGSGKSTLAMCAAQRLRERGGMARYIPLEVFLTEFSLACRERNVIDWRAQLRSHALLIIDDIQFLKKTAHKSQEELRHLIDDLERTDSRLILVSDSPLRRLPLQPDLQSRLYLAGELKLLYPDEPARLRILAEAVDLSRRVQSLSEEHKAPGEKLLKLTAAALTGDGRRLVLAARRLALLGDADPDSARRALSDLFEETTRPSSPERVIALVAEAFQVSPAAIRGPARDKRFALARHVVAYLCTETLRMKLTETAAAVGRREHGSVIHARRRIAALMERDLFLRDQVQELADRLLMPG